MKRINIVAGILFFIIGFLINDIFAQKQSTRGFRGQPRDIWTQLNETQQQEVQEKIAKLRDAGASREEIKKEIDELLKSYGIEPPQDNRLQSDFFRSGRPFFYGLLNDLDETQRQAIQKKHEELREAGKTPQEIHAEIGALLQSFGVELPDNWSEMQNRGRIGRGIRGGFWADLTEEQRKEIQEKQHELRTQNATPEEAQAAIKQLLDGFGIEVPQDFSFRARGVRPGFGLRGGFCAELSETQKEAIQNKIKELREQKASREVIHTAVGELLQSFGVELPDDWQQRPQFWKGRGPRGRYFNQLNEEQREELATVVKALIESGATKKEIDETVQAKLKEFGIEPPQRRRDRQQNQMQLENKETEAGLQDLEAGNYPNPFNPETSIVYTLKNPGKVFVRIYNANGQLVRRLLNADQSSGAHTVVWDGRNDNGLMATSGMYFYRIDAGANSLTQGMILMK